jgi:hypothetical protein
MSVAMRLVSLILPTGFEGVSDKCVSGWATVEGNFTHGALLLADYLRIVGAGARGFELTDARSRVPEVSN